MIIFYNHNWADLREDTMIDLATGFWPNFGPLGPTAGPGSPGNGPGSENSAGCAKNQPGGRILSPVRGQCVFRDRPHKYTNINDKVEAFQGLPSNDNIYSVFIY